MNELSQRSQFQWEIYRLNLIAGGAIVAFAVKLPRDFEHALLVLPVFSLLLFLYWVHHAFVLRLQATDYVPRPLDRWEAIRRVTMLFAVVGNFAGFPILAMSLYPREAYMWLVWIDYGCIFVVVVLFCTWMYVQYSRTVADSLSKNKQNANS